MSIFGNEFKIPTETKIVLSPPGETINGGGGNDVLNGTSGADTINAGDGNDTVYAGAGNDTVDGGDGNDQIFGDGVGSGSGLGSGSGSGSGSGFGSGGGSGSGSGSGSGGVEEDSFDDFLDGGAGNDLVVGGQGEDTVLGGAGDDVLFGDDEFDPNAGVGSGSGNGSGSGSGGGNEEETAGFSDYLDGGAGSDIVYAGGGDDVALYTVAENAGAHDEYFGGSGIDTLTLNLTAAEWASEAVQNDVKNYLDFLAAHTDPVTGEADGAVFEFTAFDLDASQFENLQVLVDGVEQDPTDQAVVAVDDQANVGEDDSAVAFGSVLNNDSVPDLPASVTLVTGPAFGVLTFNEGAPGAPDGSFSFDPNGEFEDLAAGETRDVTFTYEVTDLDGDTSQATVTITVTGTNDAPTMSAGVAAAIEDGPTVDVDLSAFGADIDSDDDGNTLTYSVASAPLEGSASVTGTTLTFDPGSDFQDLATGETRDVVVTIQVTDSHGASTTADVTVTVTGTNDAPTMIDGATAATEDGPAIVVDLSLLADDIDSDDNGNTLLYTIAGLPAAGLASISGSSLTFDPGADFQNLALGETLDVVVTVQADDGNGGTTTADVVITLTGTNDHPTMEAGFADVAAGNESSISVSLSALANDADNDDDGASLTYVIVGAPSDGSATINGDSLDFVTGGDFASLGVGETAEVVVTVQATDSHGATTTADITITITGVNDAPVALSSSLAVDEALGEITIDLNPLVSDVDVNDVLAISVVGFVDTAGRGLNIPHTIVNGVVTVDPAEFGLGLGETLDVALTYMVEDGNGGMATSVVNLTITGAAGDPTGPTNIAPVADDLEVNAAAEDGIITIDLNALVSDADAGDTLSITSLTFLNEGHAVSVVYTIVNGVVMIDPAQFGLADGQVLSQSFTYVVNDGAVATNSTATGTVNLVITGAPDVPDPANAAPVANDLVLSALNESDGPFQIDLNTLVSDTDTGDTLTIGSISFVSDGVETSVDFTISNGVVNIDPEQFGLNNGETFTGVLTYVVDDGTGASNGTASGEVTFTVVGEDEIPNQQPLIFNENTVLVNLDVNAAPIVVDLANHTFDFDGDTLTHSDVTLTYTVVTDPETGATQTFNVAHTLVGTVITFDPTQFGLTDGQTVGVQLTFNVDDGTGTSNSSNSGEIAFIIDNPAPGDVFTPTAHLLDFEPFTNSDGTDYIIPIDSYDAFVFAGDGVVYETDEIPTGGDGRSSSLPAGVANGVVSGTNVLAMESDGSITISAALDTTQSVQSEGTFNLDSMYLTASNTENMTVTITAQAMVSVDISGNFGLPPGTFFEDQLQDIGSFDFIVGSTGTGGNTFVDFNNLTDPVTGLPIVDSAVFNDIVSIQITANAAAGNLLIIDDIAATVVTEPVYNIF